MNTDGRDDTCCSYCGSCPVKFRCGKCKVSKYCNITCQKKHWKEHKEICPLMSKKRLPYRSLKFFRVTLLIQPPDNFPFRFNPLDYAVYRGTMRISNDHLYTTGINIGAAIIIWGKKQVAMLHLDVDNAPNKPLCQNDINIHSLLPADFEFVKGVIVCGASTSIQLNYKGDIELVPLMNRLLEPLPFASQFEIGELSSQKFIVDASVKNQNLVAFIPVL